MILSGLICFLSTLIPSEQLELMPHDWLSCCRSVKLLINQIKCKFKQMLGFVHAVFYLCLWLFFNKTREPCIIHVPTPLYTTGASSMAQPFRAIAWRNEPRVSHQPAVAVIPILTGVLSGRKGKVLRRPADGRLFPPGTARFSPIMMMVTVE